jgi:Icc-related predicted phosphoesterase
MRIGVTSDIHVDLNALEPGDDRVVSALVSALQRQKVDLLILAGDVANDYRRTLEVLHAVEAEAQLSCLFVPGNHDLWNPNGAAVRDPGAPPPAGPPLPPGWGAWDSYEALKAFQGSLCRGPVELPGDWVAIGDSGWYDYRFGDPQYSTEEFDRMRFEKRLWWDKVNARWDRSTRAVHEHFLHRLSEQLEAHAGRKVILVLHAVPIRQFTVQPPNRMWRYLNAFLGSPAYGELALRHSAAYVVCGHVHYRRRQEIGSSRFLCSCLGYSSEWQDPRDVEGEVSDALTVLEL